MENKQKVQPSKVLIEGTLCPFFETGTEGIVWAVETKGKVKDYYENLHFLDTGDYLTVFSLGCLQIEWSGEIIWNWKIRFKKYPMNPELGQQCILNHWVHGIPKGLNPEIWGSWFGLDGSKPRKAILKKVN